MHNGTIMIFRKTSVILPLGDIFFFYASLWVMLLVRYLDYPTRQDFINHVVPFSILFIAWLLVFYIAGLYERSNSILRRSLPVTIIKVQIVNSILAVIFFYFIPSFTITPKTNLFIYLIVSLILLMLWRLVFADLVRPKSSQNTMMIARGDEMKDLREAINQGDYNYEIVHSINLDHQEIVDIQQDIINQIYSQGITTVIIDTRDDSVIPLLPCFYNLMFSEITFIDMHEVYEQVFGRVPLSLVKHGWFLENVRTKPHLMYDALKRVMDLMLGFVLFIVSLVVYPLVLIGIKFSDNGPIIFSQKRIGRKNKIITIYKFRSMADRENGEKYVTTFGSFLRKTRLDELPQLFNVIKGDLSLIGPRPETVEYVDMYGKTVPYYNVRHLIKPGLSGWAQLYGEHPHHEPSVEMTQDKLAYDLFYVKNRSLFLDIKIALKTLKTLVLSQGK